jgi:type II secretory pathway component PulC
LGEDKFQASSALSGGGPIISEEIFVDLDSKFVQSELGEGFGKIIQSARLIPNIVNNQVNGFKMFAIHPDTVLDKAGFRENDVITKVNNTVMEAEQGFALYQALNDEKQIRVNVLRNGRTPKTIVIRVK